MPEEASAVTTDADLYLPMFVAGRDFADDVVDGLVERVGPLDARTVVVDATDLRTGTSSFAAGLVQRVLVDAHAAQLVVVGAPEPFVGYLTDSASAAGVDRALTTTRQFPVRARR